MSDTPPKSCTGNRLAELLEPEVRRWLNAQGVVPRIELFDAEGNPLPEDVRDRLLQSVRAHHERTEKSRDLSTLGGLTASLAHEVRNILTGVLGLAQLSSRQGGPAGESEVPSALAAACKTVATQAKAFRTIVGEAERGTELLSNLLNVTRSESVPQLVSLSDILEPVELLTLSEASRRHAVVRFLYSKDGASFVVAAAKIKQILLNLTLNALQATGEGGTIEVSGWLNQHAAIFTVSDDGPGIPEEARDKIFEAFFSTKADRGGTGLGLYHAKQLVKEQGGRVTVTESERGGACFTVEIPVGSASTVQEARRS